MTKPQEWVPPTRKAALPSGYSYSDYLSALEAVNHFTLKRAAAAGNIDGLIKATRKVARNQPVTRKAWDAAPTHATADREESERLKGLVDRLMNQQQMTREQAERATLSFHRSYKGVTFQDDLVREVIEEAHQARYVDAVVNYSTDWFDYNMAYGHQSAGESASQLAAILAMDTSTDPYVKAAYDARDTSEWGKDLKTNFNKAYHDKYQQPKQNAFVHWLEHTLPKLTGTSAIGSAIGAATHLEQAAAGKEKIGDAFLGAADTIGTGQGLEGVASDSINAAKGAKTAPGAVVAAAFSPFSTLEQNQGGEQFAELIDETGLNTYLNDVEASIRARGEGYGPAADLFSATVHTISNPANALMVAGYYLLAAPLELEAAVTGDPRAKDYVEAFARDMGFMTAKDLANKDINVGEDINALVTMLMMGKMGEVRAGKTPKAARAELTKEAQTMKDYNLTPEEYTELTKGRAGKAATIGELTDAVRSLPTRMADATIGKEPTRGVRIDHPGETLPEGWTRTITEDGPEWTDAAGETYGEPPRDVPGYHPGNVIPADAAIARMFAEDSYRQAGAPHKFGASGWEEVGGSGRTLTKQAWEKYEASSTAALEYLDERAGRLPEFTPAELAETLPDAARLRNRIADASREIEDLRAEREQDPAHTAEYDRDIQEAQEYIDEQRRYVDIRNTNEIAQQRADILAERAPYEEHTPSDTAPMGQEVSHYKNAETGEHMVSYRGNKHTNRDYKSIASFGVGLEELNPAMRDAVQAVLDIVDDPAYAGEPISLSGQSLGGAKVLFVNEWLGVNRPEVNIKKAYTYGAGSSSLGRGGVFWDKHYADTIADGWQQRLTNYNIKGDVIAEQSTPYGRLEVFEPMSGERMTSAKEWQPGTSALDFARGKSTKLHWLDIYPIEEGQWYSGNRPRAPGFTNQAVGLSYYGERPSIKLRVMRKAIKEARPFNLDDLDPDTVDRLQQNGVIKCNVETDECTYTGDPDMSGLTALIAQAETIEQTASDYQQGGGEGNRDDRVTRAPPGEEEAVEAMVNADGIIKPSGTTIFPTGPSGAQYVCTANSPFDCKIIQPGISSGTIGTRPGLEVLGFSQVKFPPGVTSMFVVYNPVTGVVVY